MDSFFSLDNIITLGMLILLQAVLGIDNLLYISLESKRAPAHQQSMVRKLGIGLAVVLRIVLLLVLIKVIALTQNPLFGFHITNIAEGTFNIHSLIVLGGGIFIIYTAMKEIMHMMVLEEMGHEDRKPANAARIITWIVIINLVFSFDSILSAMALTKVFWVMATAIVISGVMMIWLADKVSQFLHKNRMYEVLGLFILFIVGIMLVTEGGHLAHLKLFGNEIVPMSKTTFYFVIALLVATDTVQTRYKNKIMRMKKSFAQI